MTSFCMERQLYSHEECVCCNVEWGSVELIRDARIKIISSSTYGFFISGITAEQVLQK